MCKRAFTQNNFHLPILKIMKKLNLSLFLILNLCCTLSLVSAEIKKFDAAVEIWLPKKQYVDLEDIFVDFKIITGNGDTPYDYYRYNFTKFKILDKNGARFIPILSISYGTIERFEKNQTYLGSVNIATDFCHPDSFKMKQVVISEHDFKPGEYSIQIVITETGYEPLLSNTVIFHVLEPDAQQIESYKIYKKLIINYDKRESIHDLCLEIINKYPQSPYRLNALKYKQRASSFLLPEEKKSDR